MPVEILEMWATRALERSAIDCLVSKGS